VGDPLGRGVQGHIAESRITVINGTTPTARHLNPHINYLCTPPGCVPSVAEREASLAFPTDMVFSSNGQRLTSPVSARPRSASSRGTGSGTINATKIGGGRRRPDRSRSTSARPAT
jgi:hypothetical protein